MDRPEIALRASSKHDCVGAADRERVLYTLEALEKITEPGGFATVSGKFIREVAEIIRERERGILIAGKAADFPYFCGACFANRWGECVFDKEERPLPYLPAKADWCPLIEGFLKD